MVLVKSKGYNQYGWRVVQDDHKLPDDSGEVRKPNGVGGGSIPGREIISPLDEKLVRWSSASCVPKRITTICIMSGNTYHIVFFSLSCNSKLEILPSKTKYVWVGHVLSLWTELQWRHHVVMSLMCRVKNWSEGCIWARPLTLHPSMNMHFYIHDADADAGTTPMVIVYEKFGWEVLQALQPSMHNVNLCRESAIWIRHNPLRVHVKLDKPPALFFLSSLTYLHVKLHEFLSSLTYLAGEFEK